MNERSGNFAMSRRRTAEREVYHPLLAGRIGRRLPRIRQDYALQADDSGAGISRRDGAFEEEPPSARPARIRVEHRRLDALAPLPADLLALVRFDPAPGDAASAPLTVDVRLASLRGPASAELWRASGPVSAGRFENVRYAHDEDILLAVVEEDERPNGGIRTTTEAAYATIRRFQQHCGFPHLLRMWNYLDAINEGAGDLERYREFCVGRARSLGAGGETHPAATAIGRQHPTHALQVLWLASRSPGVAVENPRQVSAYHYPLRYGPVSPSFSRATLAGDGTLLISGTASIVGHASQHHDDARGQLEEILRNLSALMFHAGRQRGASAQHDLLKVYLRQAAFLEPVAERLQASYPHSDAIFLAADICRRELLVEIECVHW